MPRNVLISVYNKDGIVETARALHAMGDTIFASGGTATTILSADIPVTKTQEYIGGAVADQILHLAQGLDEQMSDTLLEQIRASFGGSYFGHQVVTLNPLIHGGLLSRENVATDIADLEQMCGVRFDMVIVDFYPFMDFATQPGLSLDDIIQKIDIGGPTMVKSAAKSGRIVICDVDDRKPVIEILQSRGELTAGELDSLRNKAFAKVAEYYLNVARFLSGGEFDGFIGTLERKHRYGENPWQTPSALYADGVEETPNDPLALVNFKKVGGADMGYVNDTDLDRLIITLSHIRETFKRNGRSYLCFAVVAKHGNACGASFGNDPLMVLRRMIAGNPQAIHGGMVITNFSIDAVAAKILRKYKKSGREKRLLDGVFAPEITPEAVDLLKRKNGACKMFVNRALHRAPLDSNPIFRRVRQGFLKQPNYGEYIFTFNHPDLKRVGSVITRPQKDNLLLAAAICQTSNSNTITIVKNRMLIGNGTCRPDRVGAVKVAIETAEDQGHNCKGAVACSDSFFPFDDGPRALIDAGVNAILTCTGSVNDHDVQSLVGMRQASLYWLPYQKGRMFFGH